MVAIRLDEDVCIPANLTDVEAFRRWATSDDFPERGRFAFLRDEVWVDLSREQLFSHNQVKTEITAVLDNVTTSSRDGYYFTSGALLTHAEVGLSTVPDGMFVSYDTIQKGRVQLTEGKEGGYVELVGSPDMVLEVVSAKSIRKDTVTLRQLYHEARIPEYWLVDARDEQPRFDLLRYQARGYRATPKQAGWLRSAVFGRSFHFTAQPDALGHPQFTLAMRP